MRLRRRGRRHEIQGGAAEAPAGSAPRDPALVPRDATETRLSAPLEERGPGPRTPVRKLVLVMLGLTVVVVAFISSYASALGKPSPRHVPVAVSAPPAVLGKLEASPLLRVYPVADLASARSMVEDRTAYGALLLPRTGPVTLLVANGGGHAVATMLMQLGQQAAGARGTTLTTVDLAPTSPNDPNGTVEFYCIAFLFLGGYSGLNPVLPQGAALSVVRGVQYFGGRGIDLGLLCLLIWALAGLGLLGATVFAHPTSGDTYPSQKK